MVFCFLFAVLYVLGLGAIEEVYSIKATITMNSKEKQIIREVKKSCTMIVDSFIDYEDKDCLIRI